jgi:hypothetical protein
VLQTITLTQFCETPTTIPQTYHIIVDKIDFVTELLQGSFVTVNGIDVKVIEPADYILNKLRSMGDFNGRD